MTVRRKPSPLMYEGDGILRTAPFLARHAAVERLEALASAPRALWQAIASRRIGKPVAPVLAPKNKVFSPN